LIETNYRTVGKRKKNETKNIVKQSSEKEPLPHTLAI
jgi:hypothetical protein